MTPRRLSLVRHARASGKGAGGSDRERPLSPDGERDAERMALRFAQLAPAPDAWLASPARRAAQTARRFARALEIDDTELRFDAELYLASATELIEALRALPEATRHAALFGHNPAISECADALAREGVPDLPPCGLAHLELDGPWSQLAPGRARLVARLVPEGDGAGRPHAGGRARRS
jgi:phosphohistidine phosphatase